MRTNIPDTIIYIIITAGSLNVCGRYRVADIDLWPISTLPVADMVFYVADVVCGRYRCNSIISHYKLVLDSFSFIYYFTSFWFHVVDY